MKKICNGIAILIMLILMTHTTAIAQTIAFTDLQSGPATGGEGGNGEYLTIFGYGFGSTQGTSTVTINGTAVAQYLYWGSAGIGNLQKIGVQIASGTTTGPIVVHVGGNASVNNPTFTVRTGHIYYIGPQTDTSAPGSCATLLAANSYTTPWGLTNYASTVEGNYNAGTMRTPYTYYACISPGDTLVFLNGVSYPYYDGRGWHASLSPDNSNTTSSSFITIMARPGATATLGGEGWAAVGIRVTEESTGYTVYSGLTLIGGETDGNGGASLIPAAYDRFVGNMIECPACSGAGGAISSPTATGNVALGNVITNVSTDTGYLPYGSEKEFHAAYFGGNHFEFAWNRIYNTAAFNGFQINEDYSSGFYNFSVHDNDIADVNGAGVNLSDIDPSSGYVQVYNNVIHHTGVAWSSEQESGDPHNCVSVKGYGSATGVGTAEIYNNTMYDCSSVLNAEPTDTSSSCAILIYDNQPSVTTNLVNNVVYQPAYTGTANTDVYICSGGGSPGPLSGSNNIWYSTSTPGSMGDETTVGTIENPLYVSASDGPFTNYYLQSGSPAIGAGVAVGPVEALGASYPTLNWDFNDYLRPGPPSIGAFESGALGQAVTSTALTASSTSITVGNSLTLTATVTSGGSPTGTVAFLNGSTTIGTGTLNGSGVATYTTSSLAVGSYTLTAQYNGDSSFASSSSGAFAETVNPVNLPAAATPMFSPGAGTYSTAQTVTINSTTSGATIYYTTDSTTPTTSSTVSSGSIVVSASETLQAIAVATSYTQSAVGSAAYVINLPATATPTFSPGPGSYSSAQTVTISSTTSGAAIYYTEDGTTPTTSSALYSGPVTVSTSDPITISAIAIASDYPQSAVSSATYTISYPNGAIHTVQFMSAWEAHAASLAVPFANNVISGDVILVAEGISQRAEYAVPTDTQGNTFTQLATSDDTNGGEMAAIFVASAQSTAADTVTCNSAVSAHTIHCHIYEVAGITTTVDQTGSTTQDLVTALSMSTSAATTNANDYVFAYFSGGDSDDNFTAGPGYGDTQTSNSSTGDSGFSEAAVMTGTGVQTATATSNPADFFSDVVVALQGQPQVATPTPAFSPVGGSYSAVQTVTISDATAGASIYYTTDGVTTPTTNSTLYSGAISVGSTETIQAIAVAPNYTSSAVASATYTINLVTPGFTVAGTPVTVAAGAMSGNTSTITLTSTGGFSGSVALAAVIGPAGAANPPTLSFGSTTPVNLTSAAPGTATLTITTLGQSAPCTAANHMAPGIPWYAGGGAVLACVLLVGIPSRRRSWRTMLGMVVLLAVFGGGMQACGGSSPKVCTTPTTSGTTTGIYTITITGTSGTTTASSTFTLNVQ